MKAESWDTPTFRGQRDEEEPVKKAEKEQLLK